MLLLLQYIYRNSQSVFRRQTYGNNKVFSDRVTVIWLVKKTPISGIRNFDVLLNVHLSIFILVINQLDAQHFFTISLFHASTCFEHHVLIVRRSKLYYTASDIITPIGVMIPEAV